MADVALAEPVNGMIEIAGTERAPLSEFVARFLKATNDPRNVVADKHARYFEVEIDDRTLVPSDGARIGAGWQGAYPVSQIGVPRDRNL
jgi:hypothetical protein